MEHLDFANLANLDGITNETLVEWVKTGMLPFLDSLETILPDLMPFRSPGGKLLHCHGVSNPSVLTTSSVHYWQLVRSIRYSNVSAQKTEESLEDHFNFA